VVDADPTVSRLHAVLEHDDADPVPVEFQGQPEPPGLELNDLLCADGGQP